MNNQIVSEKIFNFYRDIKVTLYINNKVNIHLSKILQEISTIKLRSNRYAFYPNVKTQ